MDIESTIADIRYWHRRRNFMMDQRKRLVNALAAFVRIDMGWSKHLPEKERSTIAAKALAMIEPNGVKPDHPLFGVIKASHLARGPFLEIELQAEEEMEKLAKTLPVWEVFAKDIRGFGPASLAVIVGEAGDLSKYPKHGNLWKRMGVATIDGICQSAHPKGLSVEARREFYIDRGYNPKRRSQMFVIGDTIIKGQLRKVLTAEAQSSIDDLKEEVKDKTTSKLRLVEIKKQIKKLKVDGDTGERRALGKYGAIYLARKQYEQARMPDASAMHIHRRAQRYMEQRLLKNLWQAWRRAICLLPEEAKEQVPIALNLAA